MGQAKATSAGLGIPNLPLALVPGHVGNQGAEELRNNVRDVVAAHVIDNLTRQLSEVATAREPGKRDIVFAGTFAEVNRLFCDNEWSDGLPIVPPTIDLVEDFLRFTDRDPDEVLGVMLPENRAATIWNVAVNGVMAGCRPEYMPVLIAIVEAMADPVYGVEHSGNTPGADVLITLNGPIIKELDFNYQQGALRDGFQANTTVGRFWRLFLRNVPGFILHKNDKGTFGNTWRVVLAENEDAVKKIGWEPNSVEMGFEAGDNVVTIARYTGGGVIVSITGDTPERIMPYLATSVAKQNSWEVIFTVGMSSIGALRPLLILTPIIAETIARAGWSKADVKRYLYDHARIPASEFEAYTETWTDHPIVSLKHQVNLGRIPKAFYESDDPHRPVPIVIDPEDFMIVVSGDPWRTNAYTFAHNGYLAYPVAKKISLPANWEQLLREQKQK